MNLYGTATGRLLSALLAFALSFASVGIAWADGDASEPPPSNEEVITDADIDDDALIEPPSVQPSEEPEPGFEEEAAASEKDDEEAAETPANEEPPATDDEDDGGADEPPLAEGFARITFAGLEQAQVRIVHEQGEAGSVDVPEGAAFTFTALVPADLRLERASVQAVDYADVPDDATQPAVMTLYEGSLEIGEHADAEEGKAYELTVPADAVQRYVTLSFETLPAQAVIAWDEIVAAMAQGESVILGAEIALDGQSAPAVLDGGKQATIDLNGHTIDAAAAPALDSLFMVSGGAMLTVTDEGSAEYDHHGESDGYGVKRTSEALGSFSAISDAGKAAEMGPGDDSITYYVALSHSGERGTTFEQLQRNVIEVEGRHVEGGVGSIHAQGNVKALVSASGSSTVNIEGGLFENDGVQRGEGMTLSVTASTLNMTGGLLWSSCAKELSGAALRAQSSTVSIGGNAVIAGNVSENNGGAIYTNDSSLKLSGSAVIAGNQALSKSPLSTEAMPSKGNGGAAYLAGATTLSIDGPVEIAGNSAQYNGGAIFAASAAVNMVITGFAGAPFITCNRTEFKPTDYADENGVKLSADTLQSSYPTMGGGGIMCYGALWLNGAWITGNLSSDGGGGVMFPTTSGFLSMQNATVASNYAMSSEGGGMYCRTSGYNEGERKSTIYSGYITNNRTDTSFDYGGGGIFISNGSKADGSKDRGYLAINSPIVTGNTAQGFGGGIAGCKNAVTVSSNAAVFGNTALEVNGTTNSTVQLGDGYGAVIKEKIPALADDTYSADIFSAKESTVYDQMLGGGTYNWSGYMSASASDINRNENDLLYGAAYDKDNNATLSGLTLAGHVNHTFQNKVNLKLETDVYKIAAGSFPKDDPSSADPVARVHAMKVIALKANPSQADIDRAYDSSSAYLFITGNQSNVNGGGIAINGEGVVGVNPKIPEPVEGSLTITKTIDTSKEEFDPENGDVTVVFDIVRYASRKAYEQGDEPLEAMVRTLVFTADDIGQDGQLISKSIIFTNLKVDMFFVITERAGEGNFEFESVTTNGVNGIQSGPRAEVVIRADADQAEADGKHIVKVSFTNTFKDKKVYANSVVNRYSKDEDGNYTWQEYVQQTPDEDIDYSESDTVVKDDDPALGEHSSGEQGGQR